MSKIQYEILSSKSKFKVGDRVRVAPSSLYRFAGELATVCYVDPINGFGVELDAPVIHGDSTPTKPDAEGWWMCHDSEVELVPTEKPKKSPAPLYVFSEIPNNLASRVFIGLLRRYLNRERYKMRVRGQYLKPGLDWRQYQMGQPLDKSTHLRVYIEEKE